MKEFSQKLQKHAKYVEMTKRFSGQFKLGQATRLKPNFLNVQNVISHGEIIVK